MPARRTALEQGLRLYERLRARAAKASAAADVQRQKLAHCCKHPADYVVEYRWKHDNGYGRQIQMKGRQCQICDRIDLWNGGDWYDRSELTI